MKKEKTKKKWLKPTLITLAVIAVLGGIFGGGSKEEPKKEEPVVEEVDANGWTEDDKITFVTITQTISDKFLTKYKSPWGLDDWTFAKFDDSGKVLVTTEFELKDTSVKQPVMCIFTYDKEGEKYKGHFLLVGATVFLNDGSCNETLEALGMLVE